MAKAQGGWDDSSNEIPSNWVKFNVPMEDKIFGTLIAKRQMKSTMPGKEGEIVNIYELKADEGTFHETDDSKKVIETPVIVEPGSFWSVGGKAMIDRQMQNVVLGQKIGFKFIDEKPSKNKGFAPAKNIRVYAPKNEEGTGPLMDAEWVNQQSLDSYAGAQ